MHFNEERPIFLQLAEQLEEAILAGTYAEGEQVPSITDYAVTYQINPATALKGINLLVDAGLLYKQRGVGMFVTNGARRMLLAQRRERFYRDYARKTAREARRLGMTLSELQELMKRGFENGN
ncbi:MAG: GntR family transcriptional regulator [Oscillospiraceae bacterium]